MANPRQDAAVAWAQNVQQAGATAKTLKQLVDQLVTESSKEGFFGILQACQTSPVNADGTISTTPDGTPNPAHPITSPSLGFSANAINGMLVFFTQFQNLMNNQPVTQLDGYMYCDDINSGK